MRTHQIHNKKANYEYFVLDKYEAGICLTGSEIKSIRLGKASLVDTHCTIDNGECWLRNSYIAKYDQATFYNHEERRPRKLLLNKQEIIKLQKAVKIKGYTIVPLSMFINERGYCKLEIALAKGKHDYDKRETIKEREINRELQAYGKK